MAIGKVLLSIVLTLFVIVALALGMLLLAPKFSVGPLLNWAESNSDYQIEVDSLDLSLFPTRVTSSQIHIKSKDSTNTPVSVTLYDVALQADIRAYLSEAPTWWQVNTQNFAIDLRSDQPSATSAGKENTAVQQSSSGSLNETLSNWQDSPLLAFSEIRAERFNITRRSGKQMLELDGTKLSVVQAQDKSLRINIEANYLNEPLVIAGQVRLPSKNREALADLSASFEQSRLEIKNGIADGSSGPERIDFSLKSDNLSTIGKFVNTNLNTFTPIDVSGTLNKLNAENWQVEIQGMLGGSNLKVKSNVQKTAQTLALKQSSLTLADSVVDFNAQVNTENKVVQLDIQSNYLDINKVLSFVPNSDAKDKSQSGPNPAHLKMLKDWSIAVNSELALTYYESYRVEGLAVSIDSNVDEVIMNGSVISVRQYREAPLSSNPKQANEVVENDKASSEQFLWQTVDEIQTQLVMKYQPQDTESGMPLNLSLSGGGINVKVKSTILPDGLILPRGVINASIQDLSLIEGPDLSVYDSFLPFTLDAEANIEDQEVTLSDLSFAIDQSRLNGALTIDYAVKPVLISGQLSSDMIGLNNLPTTGEGKLAGSGEALDENSGDVIGNSPINWQWLSAVELNLRLKIAHLHFNQTTFNTFTTQVELSDGSLNIDPFDANLTAGKVRGFLRIQLLENAATIDTRLLVEGITPADLGQKNQGLIDGGSTDLLVNLSAQGNTPQELAASVNGEIAMEIQKATIRNNLFEVIGSDILMQIVELVNPFAKSDSTTELQCGALYFKAEDGMLTSPEQLVLETSKVKIRGGGTINLKSENLKIDFVPTPREGLGLSLSSFASVVRLGGTLGSPRPVADPSGIFKAGATIGAALATGGLSFLGQSLFDRVRSKGTACGRIFDNVPQDPKPTIEQKHR